MALHADLDTRVRNSSPSALDKAVLARILGTKLPTDFPSTNRRRINLASGPRVMEDITVQRSLTSSIHKMVA